MKIVSSFQAASLPSGSKVHYLTKSQPLHNPFKIGDVDFWVHGIIENQEDLMAAYRRYIDSQIRLNNPIVIEALDDIAWSIIDGREVYLAVGPREIQQLHNTGAIIIEIVESVTRHMDSNRSP